MFPAARPARPGRLLAVLAVAALASSAVAQPSKVHRTTLQDQPFPQPVYHTATVRVMVDKGGEVQRHTHPGLEMGYVISGQAVLNVTGQPQRKLGAGESFSVPAHTVHSVQNVGTGTLTLLSTYVVDRNQPISIPAP